jgi:hypothetical protein
LCDHLEQWDLWSLWDLWDILDKWDMWDFVRSLWVRFCEEFVRRASRRSLSSLDVRTRWAKGGKKNTNVQPSKKNENANMHAWFVRRLKNTTTDAAQWRYAFVVEIQSCMMSTTVEKHYDRCGPMSLCFRCGNTIMHDFYLGWKTPRPMRPNVAILSLWKYNHA